MIGIEVSAAAINDAIRSANRALREEAIKFFQKVIPRIEDKIKSLIETALLQSPETHAMQTGGALYGALGAINSDVAIYKVIELLKQDIGIAIYRDTMIITIFKGDYGDILGIEEATYPTNKGEFIPWLRWLLFSGTEVVVQGYGFAPGNYSGSRTGEGIMVPTGRYVYRRVNGQQNRLTAGSEFSIPPAYAGTEEDNWITRALANALPQIETAVLVALNEF